MRYPQIAARAFNTPLLIAPKKFDAIMAFLAPRMAGGDHAPSPRMWFDDGEGAEPREPALPYATTPGGVAVIPVHGTLIHRGSFMDDVSGLTSYTALSDKLAAALNDDKVHHVVLHMDTPGGEAAGAFDFADEIFASRGRKPITAMVDEMACSAGYLIAAAADRVVTTRTAYSGSIGVLTSRLDISKANENAGIVVTMVYAGDRKIDGYPFQPITGPERDAMTRDVDRLYSLFVSAVARYRPQLSEDAIRQTQADVFDGERAVGLKLADEVRPFKQVLAGIELSLPAIQISEVARRPREARSNAQKRAIAFKSKG